MIRVMLVDDHALVRMGFRMLLADAQVEVVAELQTGEQACSEYARVKPDVVVMDLSMPGMGGLEAVRRLIAQDPKARILALSAHEDTAHPRRVLRAGALGYLTKRSAPDALIAAVTAVAAHEAYVDAQSARALAMAPACLLYDEPTSALDPGRRSELVEVLHDVRAGGMTQLVVTPDAALVDAVADVVFHLDAGRLAQRPR